MADIEKQVKKQLERILNNASNSWRTSIQRSLSKSGRLAKTKWEVDFVDTVGMKRKDLNKRRVGQTRTLSKPKQGVFSTMVYFGTKFGIPLRRFNPKVVTIQTDKGKRKGVSIEFNGKREIIPGAFLIEKNGNKFVVARKGKGRYPLRELKIDPKRIDEIARALKSSIQKYMSDTFNSLVNKQIEDDLSKKINKK